MARSRAIDRLRARKRVRLSVASHEPEDAQQSPGAGETVSDDESTAAVRAALAELPAAQRQVLELAYFEGLSQTEVAARIERPLGTVKSWTRAGLSRLRGALKGFEGP
jgi:RNA polymerase sigma-70 factor (ECF subfamily)